MIVGKIGGRLELYNREVGGLCARLSFSERAA